MALDVFYSYAREDEKLRERLETHLALLRREGLIAEWHDRKIGAGDEWQGDIDAHVHSAQIILLLVSADFLASEYINDVELKVALDRHSRHEAVVIPIILRPVNWSRAPFAKLQALPRDARPVTSWSDPEEAFADVARGIEAIVNRYRDSLNSSIGEPFSVEGSRTLPEDNRTKSRVLDAAIPSHIVKGVGTQLLVLIRLSESAGLKGALLEDEDAEAKPEDVRSKPFGVVFPIGPDGRPEHLKAAVQVDSPDFSPPRQAKNIFVWPDRDSDIVQFMLTPMRTGRLRLLIELQWEDALQGSRSLRTECVADASGVPDHRGSNVVRMPLGMGDKTAKPGEFTRFFQGPFRGESSSDMPLLSSQPIEAPKKKVGEFTAVFGPTTPPAPKPSSPSSGCDAGFTEIFRDIELAEPKIEAPAPEAEEAPTPTRSSTCSSPTVSVGTPVYSGPTSLPREGATGAFHRPPVDPGRVPNQAPSGDSPYTQIISRPKAEPADQNEAEQTPNANSESGDAKFPATLMREIPMATPVPRPKMPPPPPIALPPIAKAPKIEGAAPPPVSIWPLTFTLTVLLFLAVILVLYLVLKH